MDELLVAKKLKKSFDGRIIFEDLDLDIFKGEILLILGMSGSGKSVLFKSLVGLLSLDGGKIEFLGQPFVEEIENEDGEFSSRLNRERYRDFLPKIGFLFQGGALFDSMTNEQNILFPLRNLPKDKRAGEASKIDSVLAQLKLQKEDKFLFPSQISGGMQKRIALARAMISSPEIIFLDEPTSGLDAINSEVIFNLISEVNSRRQTTIVIISHDLTFSVKGADRILLLVGGKFIALDKSQDIHAQVVRILAK